MKYVVTHKSPDWDAIGSVWLIKKYLPGWQEANVLFVPAGQRVPQSPYKIENESEPRQITDEIIENIGNDEYIHVDTGLGPLDHHQTSDMNACGASRTWDYVQKVANGEGQMANSETKDMGGFTAEHIEAVSRIVKVIVQIDHFQEVFWGDPVADYQEFSLIGVLDGLKLEKQDDDAAYMRFGIECLDALVHEFENRIWAEEEIKEKGKEFMTKWGKGIGFETINDTVVKLSQKMGYEIALRKDPRKGYVRIKARPERAEVREEPKAPKEPKDRAQNVDLTLAYEKLRKIDPEASWFLHVSKKMLLNGTPKNPKMVPTKLSLDEIIKVMESI